MDVSPFPRLIAAVRHALTSDTEPQPRPSTPLVDPPLTTVHQPLVEMAMAATELALALGRGEQPPQLGVELATTLTVRASTAPPAGG